MTDLHIHHLHLRLRGVGPAAGNAAAALATTSTTTSATTTTRLKRMLDEVLHNSLALALQRGSVGGVGDDGEWCIRRLHAPVRLDLTASDAQGAARWALAMAGAVQQALTGGPGRDASLVLHYGSRGQALLDMTLAAAAGDFSRAWAWRQLGLWPHAQAVTAGDAAGLVLRALSAAPTQAVAVLAQLARRPAHFARWWSLAPPAGLHKLAGAVLQGAGANPAWLWQPAQPGQPGQPGRSASKPNIECERLLRLSAMARAADASPAPAWPGSARRSAVGADWPAQRALAALVLAEAEPARLAGPGDDWAGLLDALVARWATPDASSSSSLGLRGVAAAANQPDSQSTRAGAVLPYGGQGQGDGLLAAGQQGPPGQLPASAARQPGMPLHNARPSGASAGMGRPGELGELGASAAAGPAPPGPNTRPNTRPNAQPDAQPSAQPGLAKHPVAEPPAAAPLATRVQASTPFGGLLFLLNLAGELGWPQRWLADPVLGARGPRWGLHQLALRLLPLQAKDPAALALAGLLPNAEPPDANAPAPSAAEAQALQVVRGELLLALRRRLPGVVTALGMPLDAGQDVPVDAALDTGLDAAADAALLAWVCRRQARILADPGWLELHLSLDDVRTEIRGAGLDLNPGWLPWLGLVIRIVYD